MKRFVLSALALSSALVMAAPAVADPLAPGATGVTFSNFNAFAATRGTQLASLQTTEVASTYSENLRSAVYRNTLGTLDFYFQVAVTAINANDEIFNMTASNFFGYRVDAFVDTTDFDGAGFFTAVNNPNTDPSEPSGSTTTASRNGSGSVVSANFGANGLEAAGQNSATYIFRTNAADFSRIGGTFTTQDGSTVTRANFAPIGPAVPEPATWGMMILGFGVIGAAMRRRSTKVAFA